MISYAGPAVAAAHRVTISAAALEESVAFGQLQALPVIDTVQTAGGYPLARAYERVAGQLGAIIGEPVPVEAVDHALEVVARHRSDYMWAWETEPVSVAHGILDDETYDWIAERISVSASLFGTASPAASS